MGGDLICFLFFFFFKQKTAYEMRISDWSSDVCSDGRTLSDHRNPRAKRARPNPARAVLASGQQRYTGPCSACRRCGRPIPCVPCPFPISPPFSSRPLPSAALPPPPRPTPTSPPPKRRPDHLSSPPPRGQP